jgi:hypothetical protein
MRRALTLLASLVAIVALGVTLIGPASSASRRADLTVADLAEPPETAAAGTSFRQTFAVVNMGARRAGRGTSTAFFLDQTPDTSAGRTRIGRRGVGKIDGHDEQSGRARLTIPAGQAAGEYHLVGCADNGRRLREAKEGNNCRISGQTIGIGQTRIGPAGAPGVTNESVIEKFTLPIGRATIEGFDTANPGDDEKSDQRRQFANVGGVQLVADCKRTTNGDNTGPNGPDDPFADPASDVRFDEDGEEAKVLVYTDTGTVTFNSQGGSSRRNIPPGEGATEDDEPSAYTPEEESDGGEGAHMAIATARDPDQANPSDAFGDNIIAYDYQVKTIYISHSNGTELIFTGFAGIDVFGAEDQCVFGGVLKTVRVGA